MYLSTTFDIYDFLLINCILSKMMSSIAQPVNHLTHPIIVAWHPQCIARKVTAGLSSDGKDRILEG